MALLAWTGLPTTAVPVAKAAPSVCATAVAFNSNEFVSCWDTRNTETGVSTGDDTVSLPLVDPAVVDNSASYDFFVDWGDGSPLGHVTTWDDSDATHTYAVPGQYWVTVTENPTAGVIRGFSFEGALNSGKPSDRRKLITVAQWDPLALGNAGGYFRNASNVNFTATDAPDLTGTTNLGDTFAGATSFNSRVSHWDVSAVTSMRGMFSQAVNFDDSLDAWAGKVRNVTDFGLMFYEAAAFNRDVGTWDVSSARDLSYMFWGALNFNNGARPMAWDDSTANVVNMSYMFHYALSFNQDVGDWDTGSVTDMTWTFNNARSFDNLSQPMLWNVSNVTNMGGMFENAFAFNRDIGAWDTGSVTNMSAMFQGATSFDRDIGAWDTRDVAHMNAMFAGASVFDQDLGNWDVSNVVNMSYMFSATPLFNNDGQPLDWDDSTANVTDMAYMFSDASVFDQDIGGWDTGNVTDLTWTFFRAFDFDNGGQPMNWDVGRVRYFSNTFEGTRAFNRDIGGWNITRPPGVSVTMHSMFHDADAFDQDLSDWDMSAVTDTSSMFRSTQLFDNGGQPLDWDDSLGNVTNMDGMFYGTVAFDQPIGDWDTSSVTNMAEMFSYSSAFDQSIGGWDVSATVNMTDMFAGVTLSSTHYSSMLEEWSQQSVQSGVTFSGGNSMYYSTAALSRAVLTSAPNNWVITDGGEDPSPDPRPGPTPPAPDPDPTPSKASSPVDVSVVGRGRKVVVAWSVPASPGSYAVSTYQVVASPSGRSCLTAALTCTMRSLPVGVAQTVRVRALTGAGWGAWSDSVPVTSIRLSGQREGRRIEIFGSTTGLGMGAIVTLWIDAGRGFREKRRTALVSMDGTFTWSKRLRRDVPVRVYASVGDNTSSKLSLR